MNKFDPKTVFNQFILNVSGRWDLENNYYDDILLSFGPGARLLEKLKINVSAKLLNFLVFHNLTT